MIDYSGYYLHQPKVIHDSRAELPIIIVNAFKFIDTKTLVIASKQEVHNYLTDFIEEDFLSESLEVREYELSNKEIRIFKNSVFGRDIVLNIINEAKLLNTISNLVLTFVSFSEVRSLYSGKEKIDSMIIDRLIKDI